MKSCSLFPDTGCGATEGDCQAACGRLRGYGGKTGQACGRRSRRLQQDRRESPRQVKEEHLFTFSLPPE